MNSISCYSKRFNLPSCSPPSATVALLWLVAALSVHGAATGKTFASPEEAVKALATAVNNHDTNALAAIFGPGIDELKSPTRSQAQHELTEFAERFNASNHIDHVEQGPLHSRRSAKTDGLSPFPSSKTELPGFLTLAAGKEELLNRRIGRNELDALKSIRAYVDAQREYASKDRDGDGVLEYAQKIISTPGKKDGLYWSADQEGEESPLGPSLRRRRRAKVIFKEASERQ